MRLLGSSVYHDDRPYFNILLFRTVRTVCRVLQVVQVQIPVDAIRTQTVAMTAIVPVRRSALSLTKSTAATTRAAWAMAVRVLI